MPATHTRELPKRQISIMKKIKIKPTIVNHAPKSPSQISDSRSSSCGCEALTFIVESGNLRCRSEESLKVETILLASM